MNMMMVYAMLAIAVATSIYTVVAQEAKSRKEQEELFKRYVWNKLNYEQSILDKYSTPSLRRGELSRSAKKVHLASAYGKRGDEAELILKEMYGDE